MPNIRQCLQVWLWDGTANLVDFWTLLELPEEEDVDALTGYMPGAGTRAESHALAEL